MDQGFHTKQTTAAAAELDTNQCISWWMMTVHCSGVHQDHGDSHHSQDPDDDADGC